jgi:hypothetical protein
MTESKNEGGESRSVRGAPDAVREAFAALPFDQKFSTLIQIELDIFGDAVDSVVSAASKAVDDIASCCWPSEQSASATPGAGGPTSTS